ncbi:MAG: hypothetical protein PF689_04270 [Deltaproteobacteria bacterium]|jgi:hypothetical protein|nr:hypothetical protein [Deltaproteobacteria bacterium]
MKYLNLFICVIFIYLVTGCDNNSATNQNNQNNINNINNINNDAGQDADADADVENPVPLAYLDLHLFDIWVDFLNPEKTQVSVTFDQEALTPFDNSEVQWPLLRYPLENEGSYSISIQSDNYHQLSFNLQLSLEGETPVFEITQDSSPLIHGFTSWKANLNTSGGGTLPLFKIYSGLRHKWFSAQGRPPRSGNLVELYLDGEEYWQQVFVDIMGATGKILWTSWWWQSNFELLRDWDTHAYLTESERWENTIIRIMEDSPAVKRIMVGEFWGSHEILDWITTDAELIEHAQTPADDFQFMGQGNPTTDQFWFEPLPIDFTARIKSIISELAVVEFDNESIIATNVPGKLVDFADSPLKVGFQVASWHQKFSVMDDEIAWVGGMNVKDVNWGTSQHLVFDHRRMDFSAELADREAVMAKEQESDQPPRKDYFLRIAGPAAQDVSDVFKYRWDYLLGEGVNFSENNTSFEFNRELKSHLSGSEVQITVTMPEPFNEHSIAENWFNAVRQAEDYIFIEDQYFRIPLLLDTIIEQMQNKPNLKLVVVTLPVGEYLDGGCYWTYDSHEQLITQFPERYSIYQMRSFDSVVTWGWNETESRFVDIYIHSKLLIIDDIFLSVGSCNKNNRGIIYEGEMNAAVLDPVWVKEQRERVVENMVGASYEPTDVAAQWINQMNIAAQWNNYVYTNWENEGWDIDNGDGTDPLPVSYQPDGFLYFYNPGLPSECVIENISPDLF